MTSLLQRSRRMTIALALALGLMVLTTVATPLLSDEVASVIGVTEVSADGTEGHGG